MKRSRWISIIHLVIIGVLLAGCYENQEGCLDLFASNFDVDADDDCCPDPENCCCEYPDLQLTIAHQLDSASLQLGQTYQTNSGHTYIITELSFLLSDFALRSGSTWVGIRDTIRLEDQLRPDDAVRISRSSFRFTVGPFLPPGSFDQVRFICGLTETEANTSPSQFESGHALSSSSDLWDESDGYQMFRVGMIPDTTTMDTIQLQIPAYPSIPFTLDIDEEKTIGNDLNMSISVNYNLWFDSLNPDTDLISEMEAKIAEGIKSSFSYLP